jgi:drug/metabolite transporter (DMT)-like permease
VKPRRKAILFLIFVNVLWGLSFPTVKALNQQLDAHFLAQATDISSHEFRLAAAAWIVVLRFGLAFLLLGGSFQLKIFHVSRKEWLAGGLIGLFFLLGLICQIIGLATISASRSGFLTSLTVVFTPIILSIGRGRLPGWRVLLSVAMAIVGVAILTKLIYFSSFGLKIASDLFDAWTIGDTLTVISTLFFSAQIITIDYFGKTLNANAFTPGMFAAVSGFAAIVFLVMTHSPLQMFEASEFYKVAMEPSFAILIGLLSVFPSLLAFSWMNTFQPQVTPEEATVIYTLEPVFVVAWSMILPGLFATLLAIPMVNEKIDSATIIGGAIILVANFMALHRGKAEIA